MTSDGFSVKTTISQLANVARTQIKGQTTQPATPAVEKLLKQDKRVDRVKQSEEVQKQKIDPDRKRDRDGKPATDTSDDPPEDAVEAREDGNEPDAPERRGSVLDTKA